MSRDATLTATVTLLMAAMDNYDRLVQSSSRIGNSTARSRRTTGSAGWGQGLSGTLQLNGKSP